MCRLTETLSRHTNHEVSRPQAPERTLFTAILSNLQTNHIASTPLGRAVARSSSLSAHSLPAAQKPALGLHEIRFQPGPLLFSCSRPSIRLGSSIQRGRLQILTVVGIARERKKKKKGLLDALSNLLPRLHRLSPKLELSEFATV